MLLYCVGEDCWESLDCKEIKPVNPEGNLSWISIGRTDAEAEVPILWPPDAKKPTRWQIPWCWERLKTGGEGDNRVLDGWMASLIQGTWVWASSGRWWRTEKPGMLQSMGSQKVGHDWVIEQWQGGRTVARLVHTNGIICIVPRNTNVSKGILGILIQPEELNLWLWQFLVTWHKGAYLVERILTPL